MTVGDGADGSVGPPVLGPVALAALEALVAMAAADGVHVRLEPHEAVAERWPARWDPPAVWVRTPDGSATGVCAHDPDPDGDGESPAEEAARAADTAHEAVVEAMPGLGRGTDWPPCPHHPRTHPLAVVPGDDDDPRPRWACPRDGTVVGVPLGSHPRRGDHGISGSDGFV